MKKLVLYEKATEIKSMHPYYIKGIKTKKGGKKKRTVHAFRETILKNLQSDQPEILMGSEITLVTFAVWKLKMIVACKE